MAQVLVGTRWRGDICYAMPAGEASCRATRVKRGAWHELSPKTNHLVAGRIGYHVQPGNHDMMMADWSIYLELAAHRGRSCPTS